jgi:hypothetical protein
MKWLDSGPCAVRREDGLYWLSRSPQEGFVTDGRLCYMLASNGEVIAVEWCDDNEDDRKRARLKLLGMCHG